MAACQGSQLVVHFTNRKNAPFLFSTRIGPRPVSLIQAATKRFVKRRVQRGLVVTQVAVSVVLLTGSGLLVRTLLNLYAVDLGVT